MTEANFAVIGNPIAHSLSPIIHQKFAKKAGIHLKYTTILGQISTFELQVYDFFLQGGGKGLNITSPFKERAFAMADVTSPRCQQAKAANTLWIEKGKLHADNTDGIGFLRDISQHRNLSEQSVLILGAGGAARGILGPILASNPALVMLANRTLEKATVLISDFPGLSICSYADLQAPFDIVINATSEMPVVPEPVFTPKTFCYDLSYNQQKPTAFVHFARNLGCEAIDGIGMLNEQAAEAFRIWHRDIEYNKVELINPITV